MMSASTRSPVDMVLVGAGERGTSAFGRAALRHPDAVRFVAVAEPDPARRERFARQHRLSPHRCFASWQDLLAQGQLAPALVCCTLDRLHVEPTVAAMNAGYDVLLEKPMAATPEDCLRIVRAQERTGRLLMVGHVLRFAPFFATLHAVVTSGRLGDIVMVEHRENLAYSHMAHSYVRGNWGNVERSSPMILAKCCHDLDLIVWNLPGDDIQRVHSVGSLSHFRPEKAPQGAPDRCTDGCPAAESCPFYAPRLYLGDTVTWPVSTISVDPRLESRLRALETGPYGRCVYRCDNDAVDHQVVTMEHVSGAITTLVMQGHSDHEERTMRYDGTRATLRGRFRNDESSEITLHDHLTGEVEIIRPQGVGESGHGGGDERLLCEFTEAVRTRATSGLTSARASLESHLLAFAAEQSRATGAAVHMEQYSAQVEAALG